MNGGLILSILLYDQTCLISLLFGYKRQGLKILHNTSNLNSGADNSNCTYNGSALQ